MYTVHTIDSTVENRDGGLMFLGCCSKVEVARIEQQQRKHLLYEQRVFFHRIANVYWMPFVKEKTLRKNTHT